MRWSLLVSILTITVGCSASDKGQGEAGSDGSPDRSAVSDVGAGADANVAADRADTAAGADTSGGGDRADAAAGAEVAAALDVGVAAEAPLPADARLAADAATSTDLPRALDSSGEVASSEAGGSVSEAGGSVSEAGGPDSAYLVANPTSVNLGIIALASGSAASTIITNQGRAASGLLIISAGSGLSVTGCAGVLAGGESCMLAITAMPAAAGAFSGTIKISANPGASPPLVIAVSATVSSGGQFVVSPATIDLGSVQVGVLAPPIDLTVSALSAIGDLAISVSGLDLSIDRTTSTCTTTLAAGASCTVVASFVANSAGVKNDSIVVSGGGANGKTVSVPITATALNVAKLVISPSTKQTFATVLGQSSSVIVFAVANAGDVATGPLAIALVGANATDFSMSNTCLSLTPLAVCSVSVVFNPQSLGADSVATLTVTDSGAAASSVSVALLGHAYSSSSFTISSATSDLGSVTIGATGPATVFTVRNTGEASSGQLTVSLSGGEFTITSDTCTGIALSQNGACTVAIALRPTSVGAKQGLLSVVGSGSNSDDKTITGRGIAAMDAAIGSD